MPLTQNPLDALKALLAGSPDLNAQNPQGMLQGRLGQESQAEEDLRRYQNSQSDPRFGHSVSGATPSTFHDLARVLGESPNFGEAADARVKGITSANDAAIQAGFGGDTQIATPLRMESMVGSGQNDNPAHEQLYANVNRSPLSPSARANQSATAAAMYKEDAPTRAAIAKAQAEAQGKIAVNKANFDMIGNDEPSASSTPAAHPAAMTPLPPVPASTGAFGAIKGFLNKVSPGNTPYNGLGDMLGASAARVQSDYQATPETAILQAVKTGNAQSLAGLFPSSRAAGVLAKIAQEFQANYGHEAPADSYLKLHQMLDSLDQMDHEFNDRRQNIKVDASGMIDPVQTNQTIQRAKLAIRSSRDSLLQAQQMMEQRYPEVKQVLGNYGAPAPAAQPMQPAQPGSRFQRLPE